MDIPMIVLTAPKGLNHIPMGNTFHYDMKSVGNWTY